MRDIDAEEIAEMIMRKHRFVSFADNSSMYIERGGVFQPNGESWIKQQAEQLVAYSTNHYRNEVAHHVREKNLKERSEIRDSGWAYIGVENGVLDVRTTQFYTPEEFNAKFDDVFLFNRIPVHYDPSAHSRHFLPWLRQFQDDPVKRQTLLDHFASTLDKRCTKRRGLLLVGPPDSGKTTFLGWETRLLGDVNTSGIPLAMLCDAADKFSKSRLFGKMLNTQDDLPDVKLNYLADFKQLTGGMMLSAQQKNKPGFDFWPYTKLHFSCNKAPELPEKDFTDSAFWGRWDFMTCSHEFKEKERNYLARVATPEELSGILNILLRVVKDQIERDGFATDPNPLDVKAAWLGQAAPAYSFLSQYVYKDPNSPGLKHAELSKAWEHYRVEGGHSPISSIEFNRTVTALFGCDPQTVRGKSKTWLGISIKAGKYNSANDTNLTDFSPIVYRYGIIEGNRKKAVNSVKVESDISLGMRLLENPPECSPLDGDQEGPQ